MGINATESPDYFADAPGYATHEVLNQAGALADYDAYANDKPLVQAMKVFGAIGQMRFFIAPGATSAAKRCSTWRGKQTAICRNFARMIVLETGSMSSSFIPPITN